MHPVPVYSSVCHEFGRMCLCHLSVTRSVSGTVNFEMEDVVGLVHMTPFSVSLD